MGTITVNLPTDGTSADVADYNTPITTIVNAINGNLDSNNLASNAVTTAKITDANVTPAKWTNPYCARAYLGTIQTNLTDNTATKVLLDTESYDVGSNFDTTNKRYVAPVTGYYQVNASIQFSSAIADKIYMPYIYVNGVSYATQYATNGSDSNGVFSTNISDLVYVVAGQYIELYAKVICGANTVDIAAGATYTFMSIHLAHQVV